MLTMVCILMASQQDLAEILVPGGHQQKASIYNFLHLAEILIDPLKVLTKSWLDARCKMQVLMWGGQRMKMNYRL